jgi:hypothetical protein
MLFMVCMAPRSLLAAEERVLRFDVLLDGVAYHPRDGNFLLSGEPFQLGIEIGRKGH